MTPYQRAEKVNADIVVRLHDRANDDRVALDVAIEVIAAAILDAERAAEWRGREEMREVLLKAIERLYPETDGPGWLAQDQRRLIAAEIVAALRSLPDTSTSESPP